MNAIANYFEDLVEAAGTGWNRFWFTPRDPATISLLRVLAGCLVLWFLVGFVSDLTIWFGVGGMLPIEMSLQLADEQTESWNGRASYLFLSDDSTFLFTVHVVGILVALAFTAGFLTRITSFLTLAIVLSYVHRGPIIMGHFEPVLTMLLFYLCFAPCGRRISLDSWLKNRRQSQSARLTEKESLIASNVSLRLIQVHVGALYLMMGLTKLAGGEDWWNGEAMWWLIAHTDSRLVDLTFLHRHEYVINFWTHGVVAFELLFGVLIWNRWARPLLLAIAVIHWMLLGIVTGLLSFSAVMLVANLSFIAPERIRGFLGWIGNRPNQKTVSTVSH